MSLECFVRRMPKTIFTPEAQRCDGPLLVGVIRAETARSRFRALLGLERLKEQPRRVTPNLIKCLKHARLAEQIYPPDVGGPAYLPLTGKEEFIHENTGR